MAKMKRWKCPLCNSGALAPSRPRKDDTRRYCLTCSQKTGRLVQRICPALEKEREAKKLKRVAKTKRRRERAYMDPKAHWMRIAQEYTKLKCWRNDIKGVQIDIRMSGKRNRGSGHAYSVWPHGRIVVTVGFDHFDARETILHELAHICQYRRGIKMDHGDTFRAILIEAANEVAPGQEIAMANAVWKLDDNITAALRRHMEQA